MEETRTTERRYVSGALIGSSIGLWVRQGLAEQERRDGRWQAVRSEATRSR